MHDKNHTLSHTLSNIHMLNPSHPSRLVPWQHRWKNLDRTSLNEDKLSGRQPGRENSTQRDTAPDHRARPLPGILNLLRPLRFLCNKNCRRDGTPDAATPMSWKRSKVNHPVLLGGENIVGVNPNSKQMSGHQTVEVLPRGSFTHMQKERRWERRKWSAPPFPLAHHLPSWPLRSSLYHFPSRFPWRLCSDVTRKRGRQFSLSRSFRELKGRWLSVFMAAGRNVAVADDECKCSSPLRKRPSSVFMCVCVWVCVYTKLLPCVVGYLPAQQQVPP